MSIFLCHSFFFMFFYFLFLEKRLMYSAFVLSTVSGLPTMKPSPQRTLTPLTKRGTKLPVCLASLIVHHSEHGYIDERRIHTQGYFFNCSFYRGIGSTIHSKLCFIYTTVAIDCLDRDRYFLSEAPKRFSTRS